MGQRSVIAVVTALATLFVNVAPASAAVTLSSGYLDVMHIAYRNDALTMKVRDYTVSPAVDRRPVDVVFTVPAAAKGTVPSGTQWSFLGATGSTVWRLPQSQVSGLLWPAWDTTDVANGVFENNSVSLELVSVTGGQFSVHQSVLGTPKVLFHSRDTGPKVLSVAAQRYDVHAVWAFSTAASYKVTFKVTGKLAGTETVVSVQDTFTFQVQN